MIGSAELSGRCNAVGSPNSMLGRCIGLETGQTLIPKAGSVRWRRGGEVGGTPASDEVLN